MAFESVRGYVGLASGLTELTRARALEAARGLLTLPAAGIASGSKVAVQAGALADELFTAAAANRSDLKALVRSEVDIAITRLGLVPSQRLDDVQAEAARLRAEVAALRADRASASTSTSAPRTSTSTPAAKPAKTARKAQSARPVKKAQSAVKKAQSTRPVKKAQSAVKKAQSARPVKKAQSAVKKAQSARPVKKAQSAAKKTAKSTTPRRRTATTRARPANA
jgi:hypothetical protein